MKLFENPEIEVIRFSVEDIMSGSTTDCDWDGFECPWLAIGG